MFRTSKRICYSYLINLNQHRGGLCCHILKMSTFLWSSQGLNYFILSSLHFFSSLLIWKHTKGRVHQGDTERFIPLWYCSIVVLMMCLCFSKTGGRRSNNWLVCAFSFIWDGGRLTESIRKHSCLLESDNLCWNTGISVVSTSLMKAYMG